MRCWLLGAYHGINPGMGWLFAVALGMQQRSARGVWRALPPIALGHAVAVGTVVAAARGRWQSWSRCDVLKIVVAAMLIAFGLLPAVASSASAIRRHAGRLPRPDHLVVPDGVRARRGFMVLPWVMTMPADVSRPRGACARRRERRGWPLGAGRAHGGVSGCDDADRVGRLRSWGSRSCARRGSTWIGCGRALVVTGAIVLLT